MPIVKIKAGKWGIRNVKGYSKTKKAAKIRLKAIKISQAKRKKQR